MIEAEEVLVVRSRAGDRAAFEELVRRTARCVFARLYLDTGDVHRAEDLAQETYLTAWRSIRQVTDARGFRSWLLTIAHSVYLDAVRHGARKKRQGKRSPTEQLLAVPDGNPEPCEQASRKESRDQVLSALRGLPDEYRLPIMLRYLGGADYDAISQQLGLSNGSLRGLLHRGMAMLREKMT